MMRDTSRAYVGWACKRPPKHPRNTRTITIRTATSRYPTGHYSTASATPYPTRKHAPSLQKVHAYQSPANFHHNGPIPNQISRFNSEMQNPTRHQVPWLTKPAPKYTGADPVP